MAAGRAHVGNEGECQMPWKKKEVLRYVEVYAEKTKTYASLLESVSTFLLNNLFYFLHSKFNSCIAP